jgi:pimeloyl-ACP methyl ester carboxylesterase
MPTISLDGANLYYEERGTGAPILLIHGTGSDANNWGTAPNELATLGRVIAYDRRGFTRSRWPGLSHRTTASGHAEDAAALLTHLGAWPAIVVGRSFGGNVALELALRRPGHVRALALLEGGGEALSPEVRVFMDKLTDRVRAAAAARGPEAAGEVLWRAVLGDPGYEAAPEGMKARVAANGSAVMAELEGFWDGQPERGQLAEITCPVLVVAAASSPPALRAPCEALAAALPNARLTLIGGGHMIAPTDPKVMDFVRSVTAERGGSERGGSERGGSERVDAAPATDSRDVAVMGNR